LDVLNAVLLFALLGAKGERARVEISFYKPLATHTTARHYQLSYQHFYIARSRASIFLYADRKKAISMENYVSS
jgi:hypothetical protein